MTAKELREALEGVPDDIEVEISVSDYSSSIEEIYINHIGKLSLSDRVA